MYRFIAQKRYVNLLFMMGGRKNLHQISKDPKVAMTISHLSNVTDQWSKEGLITKEKNGREIDIQLTEVGVDLVKIMRQYADIANKQLNKLPIEPAKQEVKKEEKDGRKERTESTNN